MVGNKFKFYLEKNILKREIIKTLDVLLIYKLRIGMSVIIPHGAIQEAACIHQKWFVLI
jgi:hypothetical protein